MYEKQLRCQTLQWLYFHHLEFIFLFVDLGHFPGASLHILVLLVVDLLNQIWYQYVWGEYPLDNFLSSNSSHMYQAEESQALDSALSIFYRYHTFRPRYLLLWDRWRSPWSLRSPLCHPEWGQAIWVWDSSFHRFVRLQFFGDVQGESQRFRSHGVRGSRFSYLSSGWEIPQTSF